MENTVYNKNCAALVAKYGDKLPMQPPKIEDIQARIKVVNGELGFPNVAFVSDNELHRLYEEPNPYKEIQALVERELNDPDVTHIVTLGLGLGYLMSELLRCKEDKAKVFVLEPDMAILYECLRFLDLSQIIDDEKINFIFEDNGVDAGEKMGALIQLTDASFKGWRFVSTFNSFRLYEAYSKDFIRVFGTKMTSQKLNINTVKIHGLSFLKNSLRNFKYLSNASYLSSYKDLFNNQSCIIIAAGPSLNKQLPLLKEIQNKVILIAAGQAIRTLHAAGIHPHLVGGVDPQAALARYFESEYYTREVLITNMVCDSGTIENFKGPIIMTNYTHEIDKRMEPITGLMGTVNNGGSIANFCYSVAKYMGFKNIAFVGQDLAYTGGASHATGYLNIIKKTDEEMQKDQFFRKVPGYYSSFVYTNSQMDMYRDWFETQFKNDIELNVFNCTEGGAFIANSNHIPLSEFIKTNLKETLANQFPIFKQHIDLPKLKKYLQADLSFIENAMELAVSGVKACQQTIEKPQKLEVLNRAKNVIVKTRKFLMQLNSKNKFNPYLTVLWSYSLHEISKVDTPADATPAEVVIPFIPLFKDLQNASEQSKTILLEALADLNHIHKEENLHTH